MGLVIDETSVEVDDSPNSHVDELREPYTDVVLFVKTVGFVKQIPDELKSGINPGKTLTRAVVESVHGWPRLITNFTVYTPIAGKV